MVERCEVPEDGRGSTGNLVLRQRHTPDYPGLHRGAHPELPLDRPGRDRAADHETTFGWNAAPDGESRSGARRQHHHEQHHPQAQHLSAREVPEAFDEKSVRQPDQQGVERRDLEYRGRLVERRLPEQVLVAVVEADQLADQDDEGKRGQRRKLQRVVTQDLDGERDRKAGREDVGHSQRTSVASLAARRSYALGCASHSGCARVAGSRFKPRKPRG